MTEGWRSDPDPGEITLSGTYPDPPAESEHPRHYIALHAGARVQMTAGPAFPEQFNSPPWRPIGDGNLTYYQVSPEIAEAWGRDD